MQGGALIRTDGKPYFAVGFPNRLGGYETQQKPQGCIALKDITHIRQTEPGKPAALARFSAGLPSFPHAAAGEVT